MCDTKWIPQNGIFSSNTSSWLNFSKFNFLLGLKNTKLKIPNRIKSTSQKVSQTQLTIMLKLPGTNKT